MTKWDTVPKGCYVAGIGRHSSVAKKQSYVHNEVPFGKIGVQQRFQMTAAQTQTSIHSE